MITLKKLKIEYDRLLLEDTNLIFYRGQVSLISGKSGIGKTSLLYRIGLASTHLDYEMEIDDIQVHTLNEKQISDIRRYQIGFVLQEKDILEHLDVFGNLSYYALMVGKSLTKQDAKSLLEQVSLHVPFTQDVMTLSLGERQRLAIACSLVKDPDIMIMDEPTASLDQQNENLIFQILTNLAHDQNKYVIIASHSLKAMEVADWIYTFQDTQIQITKKGTCEEIKCSQKAHSKVSFVGTYIKQYLHQYRYMQVMMTFIIILTFSISYFLYAFFQQSIQHQQEILYKQFDKQLYVVDQKENLHIDEGIHPFTMNDPAGKPYMKAVMSDYPDIEIVPYFDESDFTDKVNAWFTMASTHGIYISEEAKQILGEQVSVYKDNFNFSIDLYELNEKSMKTHKISYQVPVNGILKKGVKNHYTKPGHAYVYIYEPTLASLYSTVASSKQYPGYTFIYHDIDELKQAKNDFEKAGYYVNDDFIEIDSVEAIISQYDGIRNKICIVLYVISFILMNAICVHLFYRRRKEMAILKLNGISNQELRHIFMVEYALEIIAGIGMSVILCGILTLIYKAFYVNMIIINTFFFLLVFFCIAILYALLIKQLTVENELRK